MSEKSKGHIGFDGQFEYYDLGGEVYRASINNAFDVRTGCRVGRWECSRAQFDRYRETVFPNVH